MKAPYCTYIPLLVIIMLWIRKNTKGFRGIPGGVECTTGATQTTKQRRGGKYNKPVGDLIIRRATITM